MEKCTQKGTETEMKICEKNVTEYWFSESGINEKNAMITERMHEQTEKITKNSMRHTQ